MPKVTFRFAGQVKTVDGESGQTLLQIALDHGIPIEHACGGNGFCTTCMCRVGSGGNCLSPRNDREENMGIVEENDRLSCQAQALGDVDVTLVEY